MGAGHVQVAIVFTHLMACGLCIAQSSAPAADLPEVYIEQSFDARKALRHLAELEAESQWGAAAEFSCRVVEESGGELVQVDETHYRNVRAVIQDRVQAWPEAGRQRYRDVLANRALPDEPDRAIRPADTEPAPRVDLWPEATELLWEVSLDVAGDGTDRPSTSVPAADLWTDGRPAVAGESVYIQHGPQLVALDLNNGLQRWSFRANDSQTDQPLLSDCGRGPNAPVLKGGRVYANLVWCDQEASPAVRSMLVCLDAANGRRVWQAEVSPPQLSGGFQAVEFFDGTPLVSESGVYVIVRRERNLGFEDCALVCFEPRQGAQRWRALIASGPAGDSARRLVTRTDPIGWGDDVLVQTHVGAVARVSGDNGVIKWLTIDRIAQDPLRPATLPQTPFLVTLPGDSRAKSFLAIPSSDGLVTYDVATGREAILPGSNRQPDSPLKEWRVRTNDGWVLVQQGGAIRCFSLPGAGLERLKQRMAAHPGECSAKFDFASLALSKPTTWEQGLAALDAGMACIQDGPASTTRPVEDSERPLRIVLKGARSLVERSGGDAIAQLGQLLQRARLLARHPDQQVVYRLTFARCAESIHHHEMAAELYQEVLDSPVLARVRVPATQPAEAAFRSHWKTHDRAARLAELGLGLANQGARIAATRKSAVPAGPRGSQLKPPLLKRYQLDHAAAILLHPQEELTPPAELALLCGNGRLDAFEVATGARRWQAAPVDAGTPVWLADRGDLLIFSTQFQLFALDRQSGALVWTVGRPPRQATSTLIDPELLARIESVELSDSLAVGFVSDGQIFGVELATGDVLWELTLAAKSSALAALDDRFVAYIPAPTSQHPVVVILDAWSGRELRSVSIGAANRPYRCLFAPSGDLLLAGNDWLACIDPAWGSDRWRVESSVAIKMESLLPGPAGLYVLQGSSLMCRSYHQGQPLWQREFSSLGGFGPRSWVAGENAYVLGDRVAASLQATTGSVNWLETLPPGFQVPFLLPTPHGLLLVGGQAQETGSWSLQVAWLDGQVNRQTRRDWFDLGSYAHPPDVMAGVDALIIWTGTSLTGWTTRDH